MGKNRASAPGVPAGARSKALVLIAILIVPVAFAGCIGNAGGGGGAWRAEAPGHAARDGAGDDGWQVGSWWAYKATFKGNNTHHVTLVTYEDTEDAFTLGSNRSAGFFGLPFNGNVTQPDLNPVIAGSEWPLYRFPLADGKSWAYEFMGHKLTTHVSAVPVDAPGVGTHEGFRLESRAFGRTVAAYTYSPEVEWFTQLAIFDPSDGRELVRVALTDFGRDYSEDYFVQMPVHVHESVYPGLPERSSFKVDDAFLSLTGTALLQGRLGDFRFALEDPRGREAMSGDVHVRGALTEQESLDRVTGTWTLDESGFGDGSLYLEVTGLSAVRDGHVVAPDAADAAAVDRWAAPVPRVDFAARLAEAGASEPAGLPDTVAGTGVTVTG